MGMATDMATATVMEMAILIQIKNRELARNGSKKYSKNKK
jgi:hypothetical protein